MDMEPSAEGDQHRVAGVSPTAAAAAVPQEAGAEAVVATEHLR